MNEEELSTLVTELAKRARAASLSLASLPTDTKNAALLKLADLIIERKNTLLEANQKDLAAGKDAGLAAPLLERLTFTDERITGMAEGVCQVAELEDPAGAVLEENTRPNGLVIKKIRVPIGVIAIIYESRPNVTIDCAALCLKSGNAAILRGGKEAFNSNTCLAGLITEALSAAGIDEHAVQLIPTTERAALNALLTQTENVHCIIPRGGESLINFINQNSHIPVIKHYKGVCCAYVDKAAEPDMAESIIVNAKTQRVSVCNAIENLFIHKACANDLLPRICRALQEKNVELRVDRTAEKILERANGSAILVGEASVDYFPATEADYHEEYLDYKIAIKVVDSLQDAITDVNTYGSGHSDVIITADEATAKIFLQSVDSATVYWNASTRFTDGFAFGLGAEIGISTDRIHARGPMGLRELCTYKYTLYGNGQVR